MSACPQKQRQFSVCLAPPGLMVLCPCVLQAYWAFACEDKELTPQISPCATTQEHHPTSNRPCLVTNPHRIHTKPHQVHIVHYHH